MGIPTLRWVAIVGMVTAAGVTAAGVGSAAAARPASVSIRAVGRPPVRLGSRLALGVKVSGKVPLVSVYAALARAHGRADVLLGRVRIRKGRIVVKIPSRLRRGAYFVIVCAGRMCAASKQQTVRLTGPLKAPLPVARPKVAATPAASAVIGSAGGSLSATVGGVKLTLSVPVRSLADTVLADCASPCSAASFTGPTVTLTPVSSLAAPGLGRLVAGVTVGPADLLFLRGATISLPLPTRAPAKTIDVIAFDSQTGAVSPTPFRIQRGRVVIPVGVFDGIAVVSGARTMAAQAPRARAAADIPSTGTVTSRWAPIIRSVLIAAHNRALSGGNDDFTSDELEIIRDTLEAARKDVLKNEVPDAMNSDAAASRAIKDLLGLARDRELMGNPEDTRTFPTVYAILGSVYDRAQRQCVSDHTVAPDQIGRILSIARSMLMINDYRGGPLDDLKAVVGCLKFKVHFDSRMTENHTSGATGTLTHDYVSDITVQPDAALQHMTGQSSGTYSEASGQLTTPATCHDSPSTARLTETGGTGAAFNVDDLLMTGTNRIAQPGATNGPGSPSVTFSFSPPTEHFTGSVDGCGAIPAQDQHFWAFDFRAAHAGNYKLTLNLGTGATVATKTFDQTLALSGETVTEHTVVTVTHTPPPPQQLGIRLPSNP